MMIPYFGPALSRLNRQDQLVASHRLDSHHIIHWNTPITDTWFHEEPSSWDQKAYYKCCIWCDRYSTFWESGRRAAYNRHWLCCTPHILFVLKEDSCRKVSCSSRRSSIAVHTPDCHTQRAHWQFFGILRIRSPRLSGLLAGWQAGEHRNPLWIETCQWNWRRCLCGFPQLDWHVDW